MKDLGKRCALLTGAASGIGRAIALGLAREGVNLFLVDIDQSQLGAVVKEAEQYGVHVAGHVTDLSLADEVRRIPGIVRKTWGGLDILVNNAGIVYYGPSELMTDEQWQRLLAVNLYAPLQLTRAFLPSLLQRREAHILNVCSIAGLVAGPKLAAYHASKFALVGFSESLRAEFGPRGLGVTAICPGLVRTNIFHAAMAKMGKPFPKIPNWLSTSPEKVAARAIHAIRHDQGLVVVTPMAGFLWAFKRWAPGLLDRLQQFRRHRRSVAPFVPLLS